VPRALLLALVLTALAAPAANAQTNVISTVAGTGAPGAAGENAPAVSSQLSAPLSVSVTPDGGYLLADQGNSRVRRVLPDGTIVTVAGGAGPGFSGDGGPATAAQLNGPTAAVMRPDGRILIADSNNNRIREVGTDGIITTVAGTGTPGYNGDNIAATTASLSFPADIALQSDGGYLIADNDNHRVRRVSPNGSIVTLAGNGSPGFSGDGGSPFSAQLNSPAGVAIAADGAFLIADTGNNRVRRIPPAQNIATVAGGGSGGDGGAATDALLTTPDRIAPLADGGFLIAQSQAHRIRRVLPDGTITTVAGTGSAGFGGDGGLATLAQLNSPFGVAVTTEGDYLIADTLNHRIRHVDAGAPPEPPPPEPLPPPVQGESANATPLRGDVFVKFPADATPKLHGAQAGFVPLTEAQQIPIGSELDTTKGTVALTTASGSEGDPLQEGNFRGGRFVLGQSSKNPLTTLRMTGGGLGRCRGKVRKGDASAAARKKRRLFGNASGRFRTRGRNSHATVRGTVWTVTDTCKKTVTAVAEGSVRVRDLVKKKTVTVSAGERYVARSKLRKPKKPRR
jgi:sugar lactone lactonase YvrE